MTFRKKSKVAVVVLAFFFLVTWQLPGGALHIHTAFYNIKCKSSTPQLLNQFSFEAKPGLGGWRQKVQHTAADAQWGNFIKILTKSHGH